MVHIFETNAQSINFFRPTAEPGRRLTSKISYNVSAVATPISWTPGALLPGGARTQRIGVTLLALQSNGRGGVCF
jgi:hypothetical protein